MRNLVNMTNQAEATPMILIASQRAGKCSYCQQPTFWRRARAIDQSGGVITVRMPQQATATCVDCARVARGQPPMTKL